MENIIVAQGKLAPESATDHNHIEAVDALTDALLTGEAPADIQRLEAAENAGSRKPADDGAEQKNHGDAPWNDADAMWQDDAAQPGQTAPNSAAGLPGGADYRHAATDAPDEGDTTHGELPGRGMPKKVRLPEGDMAVALLRKSRPDLSWADAEKIVQGNPDGYPANAADACYTDYCRPGAQDADLGYGDNSGRSFASDAAYTSTQGQPAGGYTAQAMAGELADVQARLDVAARDESPFTPELRALQVRERTLESQIAQAQAAQEAAALQTARDAAMARQALQDAHGRSMDSARERYGDLSVPGTALWEEASRIANDPSHPDYNASVAGHPNAPLIIAKIAAANLGVRPWGGSPVSSVSHSGIGTVRPASGAKSTYPQPPKLSPRDALRASEAAALDAVENGVEGRSGSQDRGYLLM